MSGIASAQQVLPICSTQNPCPGFPLGSVQATIDQNGWRNFKLTLTQNVSPFSIVGIPPPAQAAVNVIFTEDATGGRTVTFASNITNPCTITTIANATTLCQFEFDGTTGTWIGISGSGGISALGLAPSTPEGNLYWQPANLSAQTCATNTLTVSGARANTDFLAYQWPSAVPANITKDMWISASDTVTIQVCNPTASTINFTVALSWGVKVVR